MLNWSHCWFVGPKIVLTGVPVYGIPHRLFHVRGRYVQTYPSNQRLCPDLNSTNNPLALSGVVLERSTTTESLFARSARVALKKKNHPKESRFSPQLLHSSGLEHTMKDPRNREKYTRICESLQLFTATRRMLKERGNRANKNNKKVEITQPGSS